ncbi:hypothetical protein [Pasteurella sp. PK-2025]|uniref:hypothetical protein n=1 Tax=Pasteurella sp. PK-2025 TaxID=3413133 RepID=UPI003C725FAA
MEKLLRKQENPSQCVGLMLEQISRLKSKINFLKKTIHKFSISKEQLSKDTIKKDNLMETEGGEFIGKNAPDFLKKGKIKIKTEVRR